MGGKHSSEASTSGLQARPQHPSGPTEWSGRAPARRSTVTIGALDRQHRRHMLRHDPASDYAFFDPLNRTHSVPESAIPVPRNGLEWLYSSPNLPENNSGTGTTTSSNASTTVFQRPSTQHNISHSLPPFFFRPMRDAKCSMCGKRIPAEDVEIHFVMCLTKPRVTYNEDVLSASCGECAICLEELEEGEPVARLPCLCVYHKPCIDEWFTKSQTCPEHPPD